MTSLAALWDTAERRVPDKAVLVEGERRFTYGQTGARIRALSSHLADSWGIKKGDRIALMLPNSIEFVVSYFAAVRLGAVVQPVDKRLSREETLSVLRDSGPSAVVVHRSFWDQLSAVREGLPGLEKLLGVDIDDSETPSLEAWSSDELSTRPPPSPDPDDIAELMFTSGTTSQPKGVMRSHRNVLAASRNSIRGFSYQSDDIIAIAMPLTHSSALNSQMMPLIELGGALVLFDEWDLESFLRVVRQENVSCMRAVPFMLRQLLTSPAFNSATLPALRLLVNSSAPIDPELLVDLKQRLPSVQVMNSYGLTEASTCTVLSNLQASSHPDSIGTPIEGVEMKVVAADGSCVQDDSEGEICIRGEHVFRGYWNRGDAEQPVMPQGWLHSGDLGHRDSNGLYYYHGRIDQLINCGGHKVMPRTIERCILELPEVREVVVVGVPHRFLGEVVSACVVPHAPESFDRRIVVKHCRKKLPSYQVPFEVKLIDKVPKTSTGKVLHRPTERRPPIP